MDLQTLVMLGLGVVAVCGVVIVLFPGVFSESKAEQRRKEIAVQPAAVRRATNERIVDAATRRKQIADSLKEIDKRALSTKLTLDARLKQAGLDWSKQRFFLTSAATGVGLAAIAFLLGAPLFASAGALLVGSLGLPNWVLGFLRKRRFAKFRLAFPDALDVIIRGVKAGLPLGDCLRIVSTETVEPVRSEFRYVMQSQAMGLGLGEAVDRLVERVPIPEANFFAIVINVQQKAGGNLSEALGNLSRVLRDRKKMQGKIKAMSSEAKASAGIIGSLPFAVGFLVYLTSPRYIELLWTTSAGQLALMGSAVWMTMGVVVIKKMVSFDF